MERLDSTIIILSDGMDKINSRRARSDILLVDNCNRISVQVHHDIAQGAERVDSGFSPDTRRNENHVIVSDKMKWIDKMMARLTWGRKTETRKENNCESVDIFDELRSVARDLHKVNRILSTGEKIQKAIRP